MFETLILLCFGVANIGTLLLFMLLRQDLRYHQQHERWLYRLVLNRLSQAALRQNALKQLIQQEHQLTRQRIAQVKTRLHDEEKDDQAAKRQAREQRRREAHAARP